jgi:hypothetical protein
MTGGVIELLAGDAERAEAVLRAGCEHCERLGETGYLSTMAAMLADCAVPAGPRRGRAGADAGERANGGSRRRAVAGAVEIYAREGRGPPGEVEQAKQLAREAIPLGERTDYIDMQADALRTLAEVLAAAGKPEEARAAAQQAVELHERKGNAASAARARALLNAIADPVER